MESVCRGDVIRTRDLRSPRPLRYRAAPLPARVRQPWTQTDRQAVIEVLGASALPTANALLVCVEGPG